MFRLILSIGLVVTFGSECVVPAVAQSVVHLPRSYDAIVNREAYRNYDVSIERWKFIQSNDPKIDVLRENSEVCRMLVDYERELLILFRISNKPSGQITDRSGAMQTVLEHFVVQDDKFDSSPYTLPRNVEPTFDNVFNFFQIPRIDFLGTQGYPQSFGMTRLEMLTTDKAKLAQFDLPLSRVDANGYTMESYCTLAVDRCSTLTFLEEFLIPIKIRLDSEASKSGLEDPIVVLQNTLENENGVCRVVSQTDTRSTLLHYEGEKVKATSVENVKLTWHQFNTDELILPDYQGLIGDKKKIEEFILEGVKIHQKSE